jgi:hypothetical protein
VRGFSRNNRERKGASRSKNPEEYAVSLAIEMADSPGKEVSEEAVNAIAYATRNHSEWFWLDAQHAARWRGTAH